MIKASEELQVKCLYDCLGLAINEFFDDKSEHNNVIDDLSKKHIYRLMDEIKKVLTPCISVLKIGDAIKVKNEIRLISNISYIKGNICCVQSVNYRGNVRTDFIEDYYVENGICVINSKS